jgi:hypothetical protein
MKKNMDKKQQQQQQQQQQADRCDTQPKRFEYLLNMRIWSFTTTKVESLRWEYTKQKTELEIYEATSIEDMWLQDLARVELLLKLHFQTATTTTTTTTNTSSKKKKENGKKTTTKQNKRSWSMACAEQQQQQQQQQQLPEKKKQQGIHLLSPFNGRSKTQVVVDMDVEEKEGSP